MARRAPRHRHGGRPAADARRHRRAAPARSCSQRACCSTSCARCPGRRSRLRVRDRRAGRRDRLRRRHLPPAHAAQRRFPAPARAPAGADAITLDAAAFVDTVEPRRALGVPRRHAAGADRHPRLGRGPRAAHGRDRLLPAQREDDAARRPRSATPLEANVPARALAEVVRIVAAGEAEHDRDRAQREPDHLQRRPGPCSPRA